MSSVLVPVDFSASSRVALTHALRLAVTIGARVTVLHVWEPPPMLLSVLGFATRGEAIPSLEAFAQRDTEERLAHLLPAEVRTQVSLDCRCEVGGDPAGMILALADELGPDMVVMGTHGRTGALALVMGSVARRVVAQAHCPVLVVPATWSGEDGELAGR